MLTHKRGNGMVTDLYPDRPILLVDDEEHSLASFDIALKTHGINHTLRCSDGREVLKIADDEDLEVVLLDLIMPGISGQDILARLNERHPQVPVIVITGVNEVETAVECMRKGAFDYIVKPVSSERLLPSITRALEVSQLRRENIRLTHRFFSSELKNPKAFAPMLTEHPKMISVFQYCEAVAEGRQPVLITGETGVGKEELARAIHRLSGRKGRFVSFSAEGLDEREVTATVFGQVKGALGGGEPARTGLLEKAKGGTLFIDEIGDFSPAAQVKLHHFLENREFQPLGSEQIKSADVRVIVAGGQNLDQLLEQGKLRNDLYYRLHTHHIHVPPLRERSEDIPLLLDYFLAEAAKEYKKRKPVYHQEIIPLLKNYYFPGNIRELRAMVFEAMSGHRARLLRTETFVKAVQGRLGSPGVVSMHRAPATGYDTEWAQKLDRLPSLKAAALTLVQEALRRSGNNQRVAAGLLGITPQALNQRLKRL